MNAFGLDNAADGSNSRATEAKAQWVRPEVRKLTAGSAETRPVTGIDDGGPIGSARS